MFKNLPGMQWIRRIYDWTLSWAETPYSTWALFILAFAEASFFPIPPDVLLIALAVGKPKKSFYFAAICSLGSVIGGMFGYLIGKELWHIAAPILQFYGWHDKINILGDLYRQHTGWAVAVAGFTPIPFKVFTITGGYFKVHFGIFMLASALSRSARFFLVALLIFIFGEKIKSFIDRYFNLVTLLFFILLAGGVMILKLFM